MNDAVTAALSKKFSYGTHDCLMFCADVVLAMTGTDYAAPFRGYSTREQAEEIIARFGSIHDLVASVLRSEPIHVSAARRGDVVVAMLPVIETGGEPMECAGICLGQFSAFPQRKGVAMHATLQCAYAWRVD